MAAIAEGVGAAAAGCGSATFVVAEAGVGKSRLVREAATAAAAHGAVVLVGRAVQGRTPDPYRPITEALMSVLRAAGIPEAAAVAPFRSVLGHVVPEWRGAEVVGSSVSSAVLGEGVLRLLAALSGGAGVLLVLEDLQWADPETMQVLEYVTRQLRGQPVCCVATLRSDRPGPGLVAARALALSAERRRGGCAAARRPEVAEMARQCLDVVDLPAGLEALLEPGGGVAVHGRGVARSGYRRRNPAVGRRTAGLIGKAGLGWCRRPS